MYQKILVPLDGSKLAECVLPHLETVVKGCSVPEVIFLRVVEAVSLPVGTLSDGGSVYSEIEATGDRKGGDRIDKKEAVDYLNKLVSGLHIGANLKTEVVMGRPADAIADYAKKNGVDLIVLATHGRSGISRWAMGSVSDKVLRSSCVPVFTVRPPGCIPGF